MIKIKSEIYRGKIYAGDTPLACSIAVEQTGPMQLTIRAGSFTTTGQARIFEAGIIDSTLLESLLTEDKAEMMADGRVRVWIQDATGQPVAKSQTFNLASDQVLDFAADPDYRKFCFVELGLFGGLMDVLVQQRLDNGFDYPDVPAGWQSIHLLAFEFQIEPGTTELPDIYVLTVEPGFPPGTEPSDWSMQRGML